MAFLEISELHKRFGQVDVLMNNAGMSVPTSDWRGIEDWRRTFDVNLWGILHGVQAFTAAMIAQGTPGVIVNTGSKQGITNPPGNPAYNATKAAVKSATESLQHSLRNTPDWPLVDCLGGSNLVFRRLRCTQGNYAVYAGGVDGLVIERSRFQDLTGPALTSEGTDEVLFSHAAHVAGEFAQLRHCGIARCAIAHRCQAPKLRAQDEHVHAAGDLGELGVVE